MELLVELEINVPGEAPDSEVRDRESAEASAATKQATRDILCAVWKVPVAWAVVLMVIGRHWGSLSGGCVANLGNPLDRREGRPPREGWP
jgi:muconolactone delta-isomerase